MQSLGRFNRYDNLITLVFLSVPTAFIGGELSLAVVGLMGLVSLLMCRQNFFSSMDWNRQDTQIFLALTVVIVLKALSFFWAEHPNLTLRNVANNIHFLGWPLMLFVFMKSTKPWQAMLRGAAFAAIITGVWSVYWLSVRILGHAYNPNEAYKAGAQNAGVLAHIMCVYALWLLYAFLNLDVSAQLKKLFGIGFLGAFVTMLVSTRRIQLVILVVLAGVLIFMHLKKSLSLRSLTKTLLLALGALVVVGTWMAPKFELAYTEAATFYDDENPTGAEITTSVGNRLEYYYLATRAVEEKPLLGYGAGIKPEHLERFSHDPSSLSHYNHFHNQYLQALVEVGILGSLIALFAVLFLWRIQVWQLYAKQPSISMMFAILFMVYMMTGLFSIAFSQGLLNSFFVLANATLWAGMKKST